jgi:Mor family transcriptional regulator
MLIVETIRKIRLAHHRDGKSIRQIAREFRLSKNTVKNIIRSGVTELVYRRAITMLSCAPARKPSAPR